MRTSLLALLFAIATVAGAMEPATAGDWIARGDRLMQASRDRLNPSLYSEARDAYNRALALDAESVEAMLGLAWVENSDHRFAEGRRWCEAVLARRPGSAAAHALLADAALEAGDHEGALQHCQQALDLRPDLASYSRAGQLLWILGQPDRAKELMRAALDAGGPHAENAAWCEARLMLMEFDTGATGAALGRMESALLRFPRNPHVLAAATRLAAAQEDWERAIALGRRAEAAREPSEGMMLLVDVLEAAGRPEEARLQTERILAEHEEEHRSIRQSLPDPPAHLGDIELARFLANRDIRPEQAVGEARAAWQSAPNQPGAHVLAWCLYRAGKFDEAADWIEQALRGDTPDPELHFHAGLIHLARNQPTLARHAFEKALEMNALFHPLFAPEARRLLASLQNRPGTVAVRTPSID